MILCIFVNALDNGTQKILKLSIRMIDSREVHESNIN